LQIDIDWGRLAVIEIGREEIDHSGEGGFEIFAGARLAGIGLTEGSGRQRVGAENEVGMAGEPPVDAERTITIGRRRKLIDVQPGLIALRLSGLSLAEEQDVDDDI